MKTWRHGNYTNRDYGCINICAFVTDDENYPNVNGVAISGNWIEDENLNISNMIALEAKGNGYFFGYM
jgi:hypothetical protein